MAHVEYPQAVIQAAKELGVQLGTGEDYDPSEALETLGDEVQLAAREAGIHGDVNELRFAGDSDFGGFSFKKLGRGIGKIAKKTVKVAGKVVDNPVLQVVAPGISNMVGKGPMVELGKKFAPPQISKAMSVGQKAISGGLKTVGKVTKLAPTQVKSAVAKTVTAKGVTSFGVTANGSVKAAMSAADRLLGDGKINNSALVVRNTKALAALGDPAAKRGLAVLNAVATIRTVKKAPPGKAVVPPVKAKTPVVQKTSVAKVQTLAKTTAAKKAADKKNQTWVQKVLGWFGLEKKS